MKCVSGINFYLYRYNLDFLKVIYYLKMNCHFLKRKKKKKKDKYINK